MKRSGQVIEKVNEINADLVLIAGDTFDVKAFECCNLPKWEEMFRKLHSKEGVYEVLGNHDPLPSDKKLREFFEKAGISLLIDEKVETRDFYVIGREDVTSCPDRKSLAEILPKERGKKPEIVLDHNPGGIEEAIKIKLLLCCVVIHIKDNFFLRLFLQDSPMERKTFTDLQKERKPRALCLREQGIFRCL